MPDTTSLPTPTRGRLPLSVLRPAIAAGALIVASLVTLLAFNGTVAAMGSTSQQPELSVTNKTPAGDTSLLPGGSASQVFSVSAATEVVYGMAVSLSGSQALADALVVRIEVSLTGETLYEGPLSTAGFGERRLPAGVAEEVRVTATMPAGTDNAVSGANVGTEWLFRAMAISAP